MLAEDVCRTCGKTVVCTGGFHLEQITMEQTKEVENAAKRLGVALLGVLQETPL